MCVCVCVCASACLNSSSRRPGADTGLPCGERAHNQTPDVVAFDKRSAKRRRSKCRDEESGARRKKKRNEKLFDRNRLTVRRGRQARETLTDRGVRIIDRGSDRESM